MTERKLATIQEVAEVKPIEKADAIEAVRINGWWVVVKKGEHKVGDRVVFIEVDSWVPNTVAPFLSNGQPRVYDGIPGERLRTIKLRGQISQGLVLPLDVIKGHFDMNLHIGLDVTDLLGIVKWEPPIDVSMRGAVASPFPAFIVKTDQERIQNNLRVFDHLDRRYEATVKLDGSSMTVYCTEAGSLGVCSRNISLKLDDPINDNNAFVKTAKDDGLLDILLEGWIRSGMAIALQGELMGPKIQGNREGLHTTQFFLYNIWDISTQRYWAPSTRRAFASVYSISHVPVLHADVSLPEIGVTSLPELLAYADQTHSLNNPHAEGVVFKAIDRSDSFKVISNKYLLKNG